MYSNDYFQTKFGYNYCVETHQLMFSLYLSNNKFNAHNLVIFRRNELNFFADQSMERVTQKWFKTGGMGKNLNLLKSG